MSGRSWKDIRADRVSGRPEMEAGIARERKLLEDIEARRNDAGFVRRLRRLMEENKEALKRLGR